MRQARKPSSSVAATARRRSSVGVPVFVEWFPKGIGVQMVERQRDFRPLRAALSNNRPKRQEPEGEFAGQPHKRTVEIPFFGKFGEDQQEQRFVRRDITVLAINPKIRDDFQPAFAVG